MASMTNTLIGTMMPLTSIGKLLILLIGVLVTSLADQFDDMAINFYVSIYGGNWFARGMLLGFLMLFELSLITVFELWVSDKLFVAVVVDILLVAVVDKLEVDIRVVDISAVVSLAGKSVDIVLDWIGNLELETGDQGFDIDFLIHKPLVVVVVAAGFVEVVVMAVVAVRRLVD
ncbi:hypothetical protein G9A89_014353 [Geosiphon pyriformis]|nr:hypothetical protein G9A89_014353 [Geosiphon pyriformis]